MQPKEAVRDFYDAFAPAQERTGINLRHRSILRHLKRAGLRRDAQVLEVGCGVGTVTELIARHLRRGAVLGVDISPESIEAARRRLADRPHAAFAVSDMARFAPPPPFDERPFDAIVFPDVLEHIPIEQHPPLFETAHRLLRPDGFAFIHIPNPRFLEWMHANRPEALQVIDQPLHSDGLLRDAYAAGFYLEDLTTYRLFYRQPDYQALTLRPQRPLASADLRSKPEQFLHNWIGKLFY